MPTLKRSINVIPPIEGADQAVVPITMVRSENPEYIDDHTWTKMHIWVHNWFLQRIPEEHQHLVDGVIHKKGGVKDLLVKVFGLAARDP
jgi:hypothetical protein